MNVQYDVVPIVSLLDWISSSQLPFIYSALITVMQGMAVMGEVEGRTRLSENSLDCASVFVVV